MRCRHCRCCLGWRRGCARSSCRRRRHGCACGYAHSTGRRCCHAQPHARAHVSRSTRRRRSGCACGACGGGGGGGASVRAGLPLLATASAAACGGAGAVMGGRNQGACSCKLRGVLASTSVGRRFVSLHQAVASSTSSEEHRPHTRLSV